MTTRVLVTGARGFIGTHLLARLAAEPDVETIGAAARADAVSGGVAVADLEDERAASELVRDARPHVVMHLAGRFAGAPREILGANVAATANVLDAVRRHAADARVVVMGSAAEYGAGARTDLPIGEDTPGEPITVYGASKLAATSLALGYAREHAVRATVARPFNVIGAGIAPTLLVGALVRRLHAALAAGDAEPTMRVGNVHTARDFVAVEDAVEYLWQLARADGAVGRVVNLCSGVATPVRRVVDAIAALAPRPVRVIVDPALARPDDIATVVGDPSRLFATVTHRPLVPIEESIRRAWHAAAPALA